VVRQLPLSAARVGSWIAKTREQANATRSAGYRALVIGFDWSLLQRGIESILDGTGP
jgi:hypothetical protein